MRKAVMFVFMLILASLPTFVSADDSPVRQRASMTEFTWTGNATTVQVSGEWDDWTIRTNLTETDGVWSAFLNIDPGMYCYKLIVDDNWIFDPSEPYRGYCGGYENSIVRIPDYSKPMFTHTIENDILTVLWNAGSNGGAPESTPLALATGLWDEENWSWTLDLTTLPEGKNTLHLTGMDVDGNIAEDLLLPFWTGPQSEFVWEDALIYMVMTDRFVNGNGSNDPLSTNAAQGADWMGGDFTGVTQMIQSGYFSDMGVNALWLSPFNAAAEGAEFASDNQHEVSAYHGYWPVSAREVDSRLGTEAELHGLVEAAHTAGIRILGDFVINHVHEDHPYYTENPEWFNEGCLCGEENCGWTENRLDCMFRAYMPDVNWRVRNASEQFISDVMWWMETFDLDGGRLDAVKHVEDLAI
ncbi:MAG: alpha-amylase family glycosyl hydrolase, partial [Candidatus Thalassarchaeaceae archaeon]|nr:alpha-amylase family glycosyl hydrolase [Candidatus Thalassarchaeaceae archaeon]